MAQLLLITGTVSLSYFAYLLHSKQETASICPLPTHEEATSSHIVHDDKVWLASGGPTAARHPMAAWWWSSSLEPRSNNNKQKGLRDDDNTYAAASSRRALVRLSPLWILLVDAFSRQILFEHYYYHHDRR